MNLYFQERVNCLCLFIVLNLSMQLQVDTSLPTQEVSYHHKQEEAKKGNRKAALHVLVEEVVV